MNDEQKRAFETFRQSTQFAPILSELRGRLDDARTVHEAITDKDTPCQHRWAQGRVAALKEVIAIFDRPTH